MFGFPAASPPAATPAATPGFSFSLQPAATPPAASSASPLSSFSFPGPTFGGLASTPAVSAAAAAPAQSTPALASWAAAPTPATATPAAATTPATAAAAPATQALNPPSEIRGKTVEEIIHSWNAELGKQTAAFGTNARALAEWDAHIFRNRKALMAMEEEMARLSGAQEALVRQLNVLEVHQREIHETLEGMEGALEKLYDPQQPLHDEAAERDALFAAAEEVSGQLTRIGTQLCDAIEQLNREQGAAGAAAAADPLESARKILNNQLGTLVWLDKKSQALGRRVDQCDV